MKTRTELIEEIVGEFCDVYRDAYKTILSAEVLIDGNKWFEDFLRTALTRISDASMDAVRVEEYGKLDSIKALHRRAKSAFSSDSWDAGYHDALFDVEKRIIAHTTSKEKRNDRGLCTRR